MNNGRIYRLDFSRKFVPRPRRVKLDSSDYVVAPLYHPPKRNLELEVIVGVVAVALTLGVSLSLELDSLKGVDFSEVNLLPV